MADSEVTAVFADVVTVAVVVGVEAAVAVMAGDCVFLRMLADLACVDRDADADMADRCRGMLWLAVGRIAREDVVRGVHVLAAADRLQRIRADDIEGEERREEGSRGNE